MNCIDLEQLYGDRFKIIYEESYCAERSEFRAAEESWLRIMLCVNGHICPWGGSNLAACTNRAGTVARALRRLPFVRVAQDGSDGINAVFDVAHFDEVAALMKPRRRRRLSPEARRRAAEHLKPWQFHAVGSPNNERRCVPVAAVDTLAVSGSASVPEARQEA